MVFSSLNFIFIFLPIFLILYYLVPQKYKNVLLFSGSLVFYALGEPSYLFLMLLTLFVNYCFGRLLTHYTDTRVIKRLFLILALLYNFGILFFFKYTNFFIENINHILRLNNIDWHFYLISLTLPLGISFYTFQIVSYIIDVYRGKVKAERSIVNLGAYLCMFPQLIAGPIVMYSDISAALKERSLSIEDLDKGLKNFIMGLGYKVIIANRIGILWNDICTIGFESISPPLAWLGAFAYSMQLYYDFCGYSLMAIGLGEMLGFKMPVNFRQPYVARSVTDFWRRWHITLGAWFREYVYIPLGGNRKGRFRTVLNLFIVWLLVGFWHGAAWNFIIWGLTIFVLQVIEKNFLLKFLNGENIFSWLTSHLYMFLYIMISWILFAISDLNELGVYLGRMFPFFGIGKVINSDDFMTHLTTYAPLLIISVIFATNYPRRIFRKIRDTKLGILAAFAVFWYSVYYLSIGMNNPFLYFRF